VEDKKAFDRKIEREVIDMETAAGKKKKVGLDLINGTILPTLLVFAIPIVLTNLIQQLYSMVDLIVVGQYVGSVGTVGVATGGEVSDVMTPIATAFSTAGQIYIAQLVGAKQDKKVKATIGTLLTLMFLISFGCIILTVTFHKQILSLLNCPAEALEQATYYMIITTMGMPFIFGYNAVCGILRGMGESRRPLMFVIVAACVNIVCDVLLVAVFHLEAAGTAIATVLSQFGAFAAAFGYLYKNKEQFDFEFKPSYFRMEKDVLMIIIKLGIPQLVRVMLVQFSMLWVKSNVNSYGLVASATNSVGDKIQKFSNVFMAGIDAAAGAMIGQNLGARKPERAKKIVWNTLGCALVVAAIASLLGLFFPKVLFGAFTQDPAVLEMGVIYMRIMVMAFFMSAITGSLQSMVTGSGFVSLGFLIGILDGVVCRIGFSILFARVLEMGAIGFFWGTAFSRTLPGLVCFTYFISGKWRTRKLLTEDGTKEQSKSYQTNGK